jgi:hypothetical protein
MKQKVEQREEVCSVASKLVVIKLFRQIPEDSDAEGDIVGFECNSSSQSCQSKCTYRMLLEDF